MSNHDGQEDQHPSEMRIQVDTALPSATSNIEPQLGDGPSDSPTLEPFAPVLEVLERLEREDPKLAFQLSRLVGLYRRPWEACESKHLHVEDPKKNSQTLAETNVHLREDRAGLEARHSKHLSRLQLFTQAQELSRQRLVEVLTLWNQCSTGELAMLVGPERNGYEASGQEVGQ